MCENFLNGKEIVINGNDYPTFDGTTIRDYIHVNDLALAHYNASIYLLKTGKSNVFNCGYGRGYSVLEIVNQFNKINRRNIKIVYGKRRKGDITKLIASEKKLKNFELETKI